MPNVTYLAILLTMYLETEDILFEVAIHEELDWIRFKVKWEL